MNKLTENQKNMIKQKIQINANKFIIRLDYMNEESPDRNVYCINSSNEILWQIDVDPQRRMLPGGFDFDSYTNIFFKGKELIAARFSGFEYRVDLENGKIEEIGWNK